MTMWVVTFREDESNIMRHEYYSNEDAANTRREYLEKRGLIAWVTETPILNKPREGAPEGYYMWDGVIVGK